MIKNLGFIIFVIVMLIASVSIINYGHEKSQYNFGEFSINKNQLNDISSNFVGPIEICSIEDNTCVMLEEINGN